MRRSVSGLSILGLSLLVLTGCAVGQSLDSLHSQPEAALIYPGSTGVQTLDDKGRLQFGLNKGDVPTTGKLATTVHTRLEVLNYFYKALAENGWVENHAQADMTIEGFTANSTQWDKKSLHLDFYIQAWTDGERSGYRTQLWSDR
jgi:hypothetical protein